MLGIGLVGLFAIRAMGVLLVGLVRVRLAVIRAVIIPMLLAVAVLVASAFCKRTLMPRRK